MKIEVKEGVIHRDDEIIGTIGPDGGFYPIDGLHPKTIEAVEKRLAAGEGAPEPEPEEKPEPATEPAKNPELGDLTPELIDWRKENWPEDQFNALYPPARLRAIGR